MQPPPRGPTGRSARKGDRSDPGLTTAAGFSGGNAANNAATWSRNCSSCSRSSSVAATRAVSSGSAIGNLITRSVTAAVSLVPLAHPTARCDPFENRKALAPPWGQSPLRSFLAARSFPPPPPACVLPPRRVLILFREKNCPTYAPNERASVTQTRQGEDCREPAAAEHVPRGVGAGTSAAATGPRGRAQRSP